MRISTKLLAATALVSAFAAAPASAALTISYPIGGTSGFFGDSDLTKDPVTGSTSYDQSAVFAFMKAGTGIFNITSATSFFDITNAFVDGKAFNFLVNGPISDFGTLSSTFAAGFHTLRIVGNITATAPATGSYGGAINFIPAATPAVPEPATWAMMIGGVGFAGGMLRRRSKRVSTTVTYA